MIFMNMYMWMLNVTDLKNIVDLQTPCMDKLYSKSVDTIVYIVNRASTLAYHVESAQLLYKFYIEDNPNQIDHECEDLVDQGRIDYQARTESDSSKGTWWGFFLFVVFVSAALGSYITRLKTTDEHYLATGAIIGISLFVLGLTIDVTCCQRDNEENTFMDRETTVFERITAYLAGENVGHSRILLFYSICAISYHSLLTVYSDNNREKIRESCKGFACLILTVFMFWMNRDRRELRCWFALNLMIWNVLALVCLELIGEAFQHKKPENDKKLQLYVLPLAIDFKIYVLIHTYNDIQAAKKKHRQMTSRSNSSLRESRNSLENLLLSSSGSYQSCVEAM
ncbi:uncharacterized protein LOC124441881 isoform X2 [Xenia sp. Carnegie-2017]|nr:uncharacterized protein LOC124441881 isoform X2 [Xenia sp. Carnegie-2017]